MRTPEKLATANEPNVLQCSLVSFQASTLIRTPWTSQANLGELDRSTVPPEYIGFRGPSDQCHLLESGEPLRASESPAT
jgi:hypothetical protein